VHAFQGNEFVLIRLRQVVEQLKLHDAEAVVDSLDGSGTLSLDDLTHIVSNTADFPEYYNADDKMKPVVKPLWIEHSLAKRKLQNPRQYSPDPKYFMSDVVVCCTGLPDGDAEAVQGAVLAMGGLFSSKLTSQVTHLITLSIDADFCQTAAQKRMNVKLVLPHWIDDCVRLGRKISERPYTLPATELHTATPSSKIPYAYGATPVRGALDAHPTSSPPPSPSVTRKLQSVFEKTKVALSKDLGIAPRHREVLEDTIRNGGGKVVNTATQCTIFVCRYREGTEYQAAARAGKHVGSLSWLYYLITTDRWSSPFRKLLHYPLAPKGVPGMQDFKISVSNYTGEGRQYLENLIIACGAECTKTLKQDNTHLITAYDKSEKCTAAKEWQVHLVNHLWLEESFAKYKVASVSNSRYTHFPIRTNLGEVVGQTEIDRTVLEKIFYPPEPDRIDDKSSDITKVGLKRGNSKTSNSNDVRTPAASRFVALEKENITPSTTNSRKAKNAATAKLQEMTPDIQLYEKERKRVGGVIHGGRRAKTSEEPSEAAEVPREAARKRTADDMEDSDAAAEAEKKKKRSKTGLPPVTMHLLVTGYDRWKDNPKAEDADKVSASISISTAVLIILDCIASARHHTCERGSTCHSSCCTSHSPNCQIHLRNGICTRNHLDRLH
jgi:hypothetical protein